MPVVPDCVRRQVSQFSSDPSLNKVYGDYTQQLQNWDSIDMENKALTEQENKFQKSMRLAAVPVVPGHI